MSVGVRGKGGGVSSVMLVASEDCLEVCYVGLVGGGNYVWYLVIFFIFMGIGQAGAKRCGGLFKVINGGTMLAKKGGLYL